MKRGTVQPLHSVSDVPDAPVHLSPAMRAFWDSVVGEWRLEEHELQLLKLACEALDRCEQARESIAADGLTVAGRYGPRPHPALALERDSRLAALRLLRALELEPPPQPVDRMALRQRVRRG